jgi:CRP-like cAMP-binding protein
MRSRPAGPPSIAGLRSIALLARVSDEGLRHIAQKCAWRRCPAGERIVTRETRTYEVYLIISGSVRVTAFSGGGRQVTYRDLHAGEWFGDLAAIDHRPRSADVIARSEVLLACLPAADFVELVLANREVANALIEHLVHRVRDLTARVFDLSTLGVQNRIDAELLRLAKAAGVAGNACRIDPAPRHADIASRVSTNREQVTRELSLLARTGVVSRDRNGLLVLDVERLERMVAEVRRGA